MTWVLRGKQQVHRFRLHSCWAQYLSTHPVSLLPTSYLLRLKCRAPHLFWMIIRLDPVHFVCLCIPKKRLKIFVKLWVCIRLTFMKCNGDLARLCRGWICGLAIIIILCHGLLAWQWRTVRKAAIDGLVDPGIFRTSKNQHPQILQYDPIQVSFDVDPCFAWFLAWTRMIITAPAAAACSAPRVARITSSMNCVSIVILMPRNMRNCSPTKTWMVRKTQRFFFFAHQETVLMELWFCKRQVQARQQQ